MQKLDWRPVSRSDEYAERGDTHTVEAPSGAYYYNPTKGVVRRYGNEGDYTYCEFGVRGRPEARLLSGKFNAAKRQDRLTDVYHADRAA